ncbi:MAG TPA: acylneuraminate cytidylyltransferase family protein [Vicinamibacteria bacterium]
MSVLAVVPARSGSKSVPHKNLLSFRGRPLLVHSIEHGRAARNVDRVLVSTDSPRYREIALAAGAEAPFLRPVALAGDASTDYDVFEHALEWLDRNEGYRPDVCVHLRPTYPTRRVHDVEQAVELLLANPQADSVRSVTRAPHTPYKMWRLQEGGTLEPLLQSPLPEPYNLPRQLLPAVYLQNAAVDVVRTSVLREQRSMTGRHVLGYVMEEMHDVDEWSDLVAAEAAAPDEAMPTGRTFAFDMDGVIATLVADGNYAEAEPYAPGIALVNRLHEAGNRIVVHTARGSLTGRDWKKVTEDQLRRWKVLHHELRFGKPAADYYVDDRMISLAALQSWLGLPGDRPRRKSA